MGYILSHSLSNHVDRDGRPQCQTPNTGKFVSGNFIDDGVSVLADKGFYVERSTGSGIPD